MKSTKVHQEMVVGAAPERVFAALTRREELERWFAEHADVSLEDRRYEFWGRFTPGTPDRSGGRHTLTEVEPDRRLAFDWNVKGRDTRVEVTLALADSGTRIVLLHEGLPEYRPGDWAMSDFWCATLENLRSLLERGRVLHRLDFGEMPADRLELTYDIDAPADAVFDALIDPGQLTRYLPHEADVEARVGGAMDFHWNGWGPRKILELEPRRRLAYTWAHGDAPATVATWELEESDGHTRLVLVQSGFTDDGPGHWGGWIAALNAMQNMLETRGGWQRIAEPSRDC